MCYSVLLCITLYYYVLLCIIMFYSVLLCITLYCSISVHYFFVTRYVMPGQVTITTHREYYRTDRAELLMDLCFHRFVLTELGYLYILGVVIVTPKSNNHHVKQFISLFGHI